MTEQPRRASFARIIVTPIILCVAGFLVAGLTGLAVAAAVGVAYVLFASWRR